MAEPPVIYIYSDSARFAERRRLGLPPDLRALLPRRLRGLRGGLRRLRQLRRRLRRGQPPPPGLRRLRPALSRPAAGEVQQRAQRRRLQGQVRPVRTGVRGVGVAGGGLEVSLNLNILVVYLFIDLFFGGNREK